MTVVARGRTDLPSLEGIRPPEHRFVHLGRLALHSRLGKYDIHITGADTMPAAGPLIVASNHVGYLDGPLLFGTAPRKVHALVKESMFHGPMGFGLRAVGQIRVDRFNVDPRAVKHCLAILRAGGVVGIYPEGARGRGDAAVTRGGAAYLALVTGAPVIVVACLGTRESGADAESSPPHGTRLDLVYGDVLRFDAIPWPRTRAAVAAAQARIQEALAAHVKHACELTGQTLPEPPSASGESESAADGAA